jgi:hypothetical protein
MNKKTIGSLLIATSILTSEAFSGNSSANFTKECSDKANTTSVNNISLLFIQTAKNGTLRKINKSSTCYTLKLWPANETVHYFSDEPAKEAGELTTLQFMTLWQPQNSSSNSSFEPNVAIEGSIVSNLKAKKIYNTGATLSDAKYSVKDDSFTYKACPISKSHYLQTVDLNNVTVFIDSMVTGQFTPWPPS